MSILKHVIAACALTSLVLPTVAHAQFGAPQLSKKKIKKIAKKASAFPLGSRDNPVRSEMPQGQRAYLARLRCADGSTPAFERSGNLGPGIYRTIIDNYVVDCGAAAPGQVNIVMDMYHPNHVEAQPVAGFTIVPE